MYHPQIKFCFFGMILLGSCYLNTAQAQCGMGVPSAGNPNCIPPSVQGSPYGSNQGAYNQQPVRQQPIIIKHDWEDRWGAMIADNQHPVFGVSSGASSKMEAIRLAQLDCYNKGGGECNEPFTYTNQCGAFIGAQGGGGYFGAGPTQKRAEAAGLKHCQTGGKTCVVLYTDCSLPEAVPIR